MKIIFCEQHPGRFRVNGVEPGRDPVYLGDLVLYSEDSWGFIPWNEAMSVFGEAVKQEAEKTRTKVKVIKGELCVAVHSRCRVEARVDVFDDQIVFSCPKCHGRLLLTEGINSSCSWWWGTWGGGHREALQLVETDQRRTREREAKK